MRPDPGGPRPDSPLPAPQMTADAIANNLDEQLKDVGARLQEAPPDSDDLLKLLADVELNLMVVDQSPAASTFAAVRPAMDALVRNELLTHPNAEVRLAIASCISEVTRITAPEAPYDDNIMRDLFSIIVGTFQNLDDIESPSFSRRLSVLETLAKVRSCVVMLDLELDDLILQMFKHFFATVTSKQPEIIISCMATTMKLVIDESEEIQTALASYLLQKARNEERETSPASFQLAEKVISSCEDGKLKPIFLQLLQVQGTPLDEYSKIVRLVCEGGKVIRKDNIVDLTGKDTVDDGKLSERTISDELPQESSKLEQDGAPTTAISSGATLVDNGEANQGPVSPKGQASPKGPASPKKKPEEPEDTKGADQLKSANDEGVEPVDAMPKKSSDVDSEKDLKLKHCNSVATPRSNVDVDKEAHVISGELSADKKVVNGVADNVPKRADTAPDIVKPKRGRPPGPKSSEKKAARNNQSSGLDLKKTEEAMDSTGKLTKRSAKDDIKSSTKKTGEGESSKKTARNNQSSDLDLKKTEEAMDSTGKLTKRSAKDDVKSSTKRAGEGESPKKQQKPSLKQHKEEVLSEEDTAKDMTLKEMVSPKSLTKGSGRTKGQGGDNNVVKRKREQDTEELPRSRKDKGLDGSLVGARIKVWWPDDEMFYKGVVDSFDNHSKRHKVAYDDGDVEVLLLRDEKWDFISEEESKTPDVPSDIPRGRKGRGITLLPVKEEKIETPKSDGGALPKKRGRPKGWRPNNGTPSKSKGKTAMKDAKGTPKTPSEIKKEVKEKATTGSANKAKDDLAKDSSNEKLKEVGSKGKDVSKSGDGSVKGRPGRKPKSSATTPVVASGSGSVQEKRKEKEAQKEEKEEAEASEMEQEASGKGASSTGKKRRRKA